MSPKIPASATPMASTTAMQPAGMASIAVRVEIGDDQDSGVARSSRAGTKRSVKACPTSRFCPGCSGLVPRIQTFRRPFLSSTVVMVAVETPDRVAMASGDRDIWDAAPEGWKKASASCEARMPRQGLAETDAITTSYRRHADKLF